MPGDLILQQEGWAEVMQEQFRVAVRNVLSNPSFPATQFVQDLLSLKITLQESLSKKVRADIRQDSEADRMERAKLGNNPTNAQSRRFAKQLFNRMQNVANEEPHESFSTGVAIAFVIQSLGKELLPASHLIRLMFQNRYLARIASDAIGRMGCDGLEFYQDLLVALEQADQNFYHAKALGALLRSVPEKLNEILNLACGTDIQVRINAVAALGYCGRPHTSKLPEIETRLCQRIEKCEAESEWHGLVFALGEIAQTTESVFLLLKFLQLKDSDKVGTTISALGHIGKEPAIVVPRLIGMLDAFEEFDQDWECYGERERVIDSLRRFGTAAESAVPVLLRHVWRKRHKPLDPPPKEPDEGVIRFLGELGVLAREALPILIEVRKIARPDAAEELDDEDYLDLAIKKIQQSA